MHDVPFHYSACSDKRIYEGALLSVPRRKGLSDKHFEQPFLLQANKHIKICFLTNDDDVAGLPVC